MNFFITGTDTGVGKTYFTALLTRALREAGFDTVALKPLCSGERDDVETLRDAADGALTPDEINPYWFQAPVAPLAAARQEEREIDLAALGRWFEERRARYASLLVEGAGGWLVPVTARATVADLAALFQLPVLVVVANRLGCLNHALLTVESIRARGLTCAGWVLNSLHGTDDPAAATNRQVLEEFCDAPFFAEIKAGDTRLELPARQRFAR